MDETIITSFCLPNNEDIRILIVDDDPLVQLVIQSYISSHGYYSALAGDGLEAVSKLQEEVYDIVVTDVNMPNMDGIELLKHININYPDTGVIVVTGFSEEYSYMDVINLGAIDYMTKPLDGNEFLARLKRVVREQAMMKELKQLSIRDPLTGLYNRRYFDVKIAEELHRGVRQNYAVFLAFVDVDKFKDYNDAFGHQAGDRLLVSVANIMSNCARYGVDYVFRQGGDEFAIIITQTQMEQAKKICERIRETFSETTGGSPSLSFGLAQFKLLDGYFSEKCIVDFLEKTDQTLYQAKNTGRNKIVCL